MERPISSDRALRSPRRIWAMRSMSRPPTLGCPTMLEVQDLSVSYGPVSALSSVTFSAQPGAITAILGANGAGKTTLLRAITGLVRPRSGIVRFAGEELLGRAVENIARRGVAHIPE